MEDIKFFEPQDFDPTVMLSCIGVIALIIFIIVYGSYRYKKYKSYKEFETEMNLLELDDNQENALNEMVKNLAKEEPVKILASKRLFDEMASKEIYRVLGSPGSAGAKQTFINMLYDIRRKAYNPDWSRNFNETGQEQAKKDEILST